MRLLKASIIHLFDSGLVVAYAEIPRTYTNDPSQILVSFPDSLQFGAIVAMPQNPQGTEGARPMSRRNLGQAVQENVMNEMICKEDDERWN